MKANLIGLYMAGMLSVSVCAQRSVQPPVMGWSSWNTYRVQISDSLIRSQADAMVRTGLREVGYRYINIDDGFFGGRTVQGKLKAHPQRFPNGLRPVADYIHSLGLKAGIYSDAGRNTCGSFWDKDAAGIGVGFYGHDQQDADFYFKECGFDFIKIDFCGGDAAQNSEQLQLDERKRYLQIRAAINAVGRDDVKVNICRWAFPGTWVSLAGSSWRIAGDIAPTWNSVKQIINRNKYLSAYATRGCYNDMDMLEIGRGLTPEEERTHFGMWCIMSSPLLVGCDMNHISAASLALLKNKALVALNQDPLGLQAYVVKEENGVALLVKDIQQRQGLQRAVALCNLSDEERTFSFDLSDVDLGGVVQVFDLFAGGEPTVVIDGKMKVTLKPHDTHIYRLEATRRFERRVYEAETAWLENFQCLKNPLAAGTAYYEAAPGCSGGAKVCGLGGNPDNWLEWRYVYSQNGGDYVMYIDYSCEDFRKLCCRVNGKDDFVKIVSSGAVGRTGHCLFSVRLVPGVNTIRLFSDEGKCPDIDVMRLEQKVASR